MKVTKEDRFEKKTLMCVAEERSRKQEIVSQRH